MRVAVRWGHGLPTDDVAVASAMRSTPATDVRSASGARGSASARLDLPRANIRAEVIVVRFRPAVAVLGDPGVVVAAPLRALVHAGVDPARRSTIVGASTSILGLPGALDPNEAAAISTAARRAFPRLELALSPLLPRLATLRPVDGTDCMMPASYVEGRWSDRSWRASWGHRLVGLEHAVPAGLLDDVFSRRVRPMLAAWLSVAQEAYDFLGRAPPASTAMFEYVDRVVLARGVADLSRAFKLNVALEAAGSVGGLTSVTVGARIDRPEREARVALTVEAVRGDLDAVVVHVRTAVERDLEAGLTLGSGAALLQAVGEAEALATETYVSLMTEDAFEEIR